MSKAHWAIKRANEIGYFPPLSWGSLINVRCGEVWERKYGKPSRGKVDEAKFLECLDIAIAEIVSEKSRKRSPKSKR